MEVELKKWQFINITNLKLLAASLAGLIIVATVNNLIPFIVAPTFGQVLWTSSFAQSYINGGWPSIYATNIGIPNPQPISYGLVGPFLQSAISVLLDISMVNSYTIAQLILIAAAFYGCVKFAGLFLKNHYFAIISAVVFLSLPIVWFHQSFGTLAIGFASMPGYFFVIIHFLESLREPQNSRTAKIINGFILILVALFSVFIDGYTFVMFAISAGILGIIYWLKYRKGSLFAGGVYIALVFAASYYLYDLFILDMSFQKEGVTFFNAWGIDLVMLFAPIKSVSAALDRFGLSIPIDTKRFYGDATVWRSSFILPLLIPAIFGFFIKKDRKPLYTILLIIGLIGLYFSLGPWLKVNSLRPIDQHGEITYTLPIPPSPVGIFPTGSSFINTSVPGFNSMRATYRWIILTYVFLFASASVLLDSLIRRKKYLIALVGILLVFIVSIPDPIQQFEVGKSSLQRFYQLDQTIKELRPLLEGKKVLFLPLGNDFLQGYISS